MKNKKDILIKESKIATFCKKKGWDVKNLTTEQMLIVSRLIAENKI